MISDETRESGNLPDHLRRLRVIRDAAVARRDFSAAVAAEVARGRAMGFYRHRQAVGRATATIKITVCRSGIREQAITIGPASRVS